MKVTGRHTDPLCKADEIDIPLLSKEGRRASAGVVTNVAKHPIFNNGRCATIYKVASRLHKPPRPLSELPLLGKEGNVHRNHFLCKALPLGQGEPTAKRSRGSLCRPAAATFLLLLFLFACSHPQEKTSIQMAVGGQTQFIYLPLTLADRLGYFKDEGLTVNISDLRGGSEALAALMG